MPNKINFTYATDDGISVNFSLKDDCNLTDLTAYFIIFTEMIGFYPKSWEDVLENLNKDGGLDSSFTAYDWANAILYD